MASTNCNLVGQITRGNATTAYITDSVKLGYDGSKYYNYRLKFQTPAFTGAVSSVTFNLKIVNSHYPRAVFRYALCTSDANTAMYENTTKAVTTDSYQIASGIFDCNGINSGAINQLVINVDDIRGGISPSATYYLMLWTYENTSASPAIYKTYATVMGLASHSATVEHSSAYTVTVTHATLSANGSSIVTFEEAAYEVESGSSFTPTAVRPPDTHTTEDAVYEAWDADTTTQIVRGAPDVDSFVVTSNVRCTVLYRMIHMVTTQHYAITASGSLELLSEVSERVTNGRAFTPAAIDLPAIYTTDGAYFEARTASGIEVHNQGIPGADYIKITGDIYIEVCYPLAGGFMYVNIGGEAYKHEIWLKRKGKAVRCFVYVKGNSANPEGIAVPVYSGEIYSGEVK